MLIDGREFVTGRQAAAHFGLPNARSFREWARRAGFPSAKKPGSHLILWDLEAIEERLRSTFHVETAT